MPAPPSHDQFSPQAQPSNQGHNRNNSYLHADSIQKAPNTQVRVLNHVWPTQKQENVQRLHSPLHRVAHPPYSSNKLRPPPRPMPPRGKIPRAPISQPHKQITLHATESSHTALRIYRRLRGADTPPSIGDTSAGIERERSIRA